MSSGRIEEGRPPSPYRERNELPSPRGTQNRITDLTRNMLTRSGHALLISPRRIVSPISEAPKQLAAIGAIYITGEAGNLFQEAVKRESRHESLSEILELYRRCTYNKISLAETWGLPMSRLLELSAHTLRRLRSSLAWYLLDWASTTEGARLAEQILSLEEDHWDLLQKHYPPTGLYMHGLIEALLVSECPIGRILDPQISPRKWQLLATTPGGVVLQGEEFPFQDFWWRPLICSHMPFIALLELSEEMLKCLRSRTTTCTQLLREGFPPSLLFELMVKDRGESFIWLLDHASPLFRALRLGATPSLFVTISPSRWDCLVSRWELIQVVLAAGKLKWTASPEQTASQIMRIIRVSDEEAEQWLNDLARLQQDIYAWALELEEKKISWSTRQRVGATWIWLSDRIGMPVYDQIDASTPLS